MIFFGGGGGVWGGSGGRDFCVVDLGFAHFTVFNECGDSMVSPALVSMTFAFSTLACLPVMAGAFWCLHYFVVVVFCCFAHDF